MHKRLLYILVAFISFLLFMVIGHAFLKPQSLARVIKMDEGWNVRYNDTEFTDVKLSDLRGLIVLRAVRRLRRVIDLIGVQEN